MHTPIPEFWQHLPNALKAVAPKANPAILDALAQALPGLLATYSIDTALRLAHFLAQTAHESGGYTRFRENLNYSADGLRRTFPSHFRSVNPVAYARKPEQIANHVYANRLGNGPESSGDGWKFRGRGLIQLTGRANYADFSSAAGRSCLLEPDYLATPEGAAESAAWYWMKHHINPAADRDDCKAVTKLINGGYLGLEEREGLLAKAKAALGI